MVETLEQAYEQNLTRKLEIAVCSIPQVFFTHAEQEFFNYCGQVESKGYPDLAKKFRQDYMDKKLHYIKSWMGGIL